MNFASCAACAAAVTCAIIADAQPISALRSVGGTSFASDHDPGARFSRSFGTEAFGPWSEMVTGGVGYQTFGTNFRASQQSFAIQPGTISGQGQAALTTYLVPQGASARTSAGSGYEFTFVVPAGTVLRFEASTSVTGFADDRFAYVELIGLSEVFRVSLGRGESVPESGIFETVGDGNGYTLRAGAIVTDESFAGSSAQAEAAWTFALTAPSPASLSILGLAMLARPRRRR